MKKIIIITGIAAAVFVAVSCSNVKSKPGRTYMPDMAYSRAYETYAALDTAKFTNKESEIGEEKIFYNSLPVQGTVARGEMAAYPYKNDSLGYVMSATVQNPLPALTADELKEAERLYLVNCGICHGAKLDGNGPLYNDGAGPFLAAPRNLVTDPVITGMAEGTMFHSVTYGRNTMGSYASQLTTKQRWMIIHFIKSKHKTGKPGAAADTATAK